MTQTARVYGGSLYDLAAEEQLSDEILSELNEIVKLFREDPDYLRLLKEPAIDLDERKGLIEKAFGGQAERYVVNFLKILCERGILGEFEGCTEEFTRRYNADHNIAEAVVISAVALSDGQAAALKSRLEKVSGKTVTLTNKIDPAIVGGLKVELEGSQFDGTVSGRLAGISGKLSEIIV